MRSLTLISWIVKNLSVPRGSCKDLHQSVAILCIDGESPIPDSEIWSTRLLSKAIYLWSYLLLFKRLNIETSWNLHSIWTKESLQAQIWIYETLKDHDLLLFLMSFKIMLHETVPTVAGWVSNTLISAFWIGFSIRSGRRPRFCFANQLWHAFVVTSILSVHGTFIRILWQLFAPWK